MLKFSEKQKQTIWQTSANPAGKYRYRSTPEIAESRQRNDKPGSVAGAHFSWMPITRHLQQPTRRSANRTDSRRQMPPSLLLGLAPDGVYPASRSPELLVRSYRTVSPLPRRGAKAKPLHRRSAVCFLLHFPDPRGRWALPTIVSYGARTFL